MSETTIANTEAVGKHTPGPWELEDTTLAICRLIVSVEEVKAIEVHPAETPDRVVAYLPADMHVDEQRANANLIAAAPDLLAALRRAIETIRAFHGIGLGKAEEETWRLYQSSPEMQAINAAIAKAEGRTA